MTTANDTQDVTVVFSATTSATPIGYQPHRPAMTTAMASVTATRSMRLMAAMAISDGLFDFLQGHVASLPNPLTGDYLT
ncbi:MAG: hypothetical protein R3F53_21600 [Gammaproteobacteria bacterium]